MNLLELTLQGGMFIGAILLLRALGRYRLPAWSFRLLWGAALARLLLPVPLPFPWNVYAGLERLLSPGKAASLPPAEGGSLTLTTPLPSWEEPPRAGEPMAALEDTLFSGTLPAPGPNIPWLTLVWLAGALALAGVFLWNYRQCFSVFRTALPLRHPAVNQWRSRWPALRGVPIRRCDRIGTPLTYGLLRPVILLPKGLNCDNEEELGYILLHESAHIQNRDAWWKLLLAAALCVHWFNPLVWCMYVCASRDLERCCDEAVIRRCGLESRSAYALTLLRWEERRSGLLPLCSTFSNRIMKERVISIMKLKKQSAAALILALALVAGTTAAFATSPAPQEEPQAPASQEIQTPEPQPGGDAAPVETVQEPVTQAPAQAEDPEAPAEPVQTVQEPAPQETAPEEAAPQQEPAPAEDPFAGRWDIPEGELPQWYEFPIANLEEGEALAAYLQQTKGLKEGDVQYHTPSNGPMTLQISYTQTQEEAQFQADCPNGEYPKNSKGETYGSNRYEVYIGYKPDLIAVIATDTRAHGYVESSQLNGYYGYPYPVNNPEDAAAYMEWLKTQPPERHIPVYDVEHETVLGYFLQTNDESLEYVRTQEEIEEEIQMVTDMMERQGYPQEEIDAYIQQLRDKYAQ